MKNKNLAIYERITISNPENMSRKQRRAYGKAKGIKIKGSKIPIKNHAKD